MAKTIFKTNYYVNGKCVWMQESPSILSDAEIEKSIKQIAGYGYGQVDAITDTTGRMVTFDANGSYLKEVDES